MIARLDHVKMRAADAAKQAAKTEVSVSAGESPTEKKPESGAKVEGGTEK